MAERPLAARAAATRRLVTYAGCRCTRHFWPCLEDVDGGVDLADDAGERDDVEDALAATQQVDDLFARAGKHRALGTDDEICRREVPARFAHAFDRPACVLQVDSGVEEALDDLQLEDVAVRIEPLGPRPPRVDERGPQEAGARPVVELAVGDPDDLADSRAAVALTALWQHHFALPRRPCGADHRRVTTRL